MRVWIKCDYCLAHLNCIEGNPDDVEFFYPPPHVCQKCQKHLLLSTSEEPVNNNIGKAIKEELLAQLNAEENLSLKTLARIERLASNARTLLASLSGKIIPKPRGNGYNGVIYGPGQLQAQQEVLDDDDSDEAATVEPSGGMMSALVPAPYSETGGASMIQNLVASIASLQPKPAEIPEFKESTESLVHALIQARDAGLQDIANVIEKKIKDSFAANKAAPVFEEHGDHATPGDCKVCRPFDSSKPEYTSSKEIIT